jgi:hypothetical protein
MVGKAASRNCSSPLVLVLCQKNFEYSGLEPQATALYSLQGLVFTASPATAPIHDASAPDRPPPELREAVKSRENSPQI